ncbi:S24 family peptidase [Photobacterium atrarenae]|uniref:XRE family transcriptional regulator n=1 Tax=Photobacterium atrarenae TaxID=865757 RepID=A0ABY5GLR4_9GAMM|nr:S24 family peptidase [Photobacterium atrarenae]UTV30197.1 XRE family transcriptional regulator [Photobacterium atrarenae]
MNEKSNTVAFDEDGIATFPERLKELIGNESLRKFGQAVGISEGGLRKYLPPGSSKPTFDKLVAIARYKGVNLEWLATGNGAKDAEIKQAGPHLEGSRHQESGYLSVDEFNEEFVLVPGYHIQVSAGNGSCAIDAPVKRYLAFRRKYIKYKGLDPKQLAIVFAKGDSMEPTIKDNDSLLVDLSSRTPIDGNIFVVRLGDELYAKRVQKSYDGSIRLISDNKEYQTIEVPKEELGQICIIGRVVQRATDL